MGAKSTCKFIKTLRAKSKLTINLTTMTNIQTCYQDKEQLAPSYTAKGMQKDSGNLENVSLYYSTAVLILGNHSRDLKTHVYKETGMRIFTAIVFTMTPN